MKENKCFCPLYNSLIDKELCNKVSNNKVDDFRIKKIPNYKNICLNCVYHITEDLEKTLDFSKLQEDINRLKAERNGK